MVGVLALLRSHPTRVWPFSAVKRSVPGYESGAGDRTWQHDSAALREQGLIKWATRASDGTRGVQYGLPLKPLDLHLSEQEHAALVDARRARGFTVIPSPLEGGSTEAPTWRFLVQPCAYWRSPGTGPKSATSPAR